MTVKRPEGCRMLHIAKQIDTQGVITFETPIRIPGLESVEYTYGYAEAQAYSDNQMDTNKRKPSFADLAIVLRELSNQHEALIMGKTYTGGKKITSTSDVAPRFAVLWEQTNSDGTSTFIGYYNVTLSKDGGTNTTIGESITYDTVSVTGKAIPLSNGDLDIMIESDDKAANQQDIENFFKKVILRGSAPSQDLILVDPLKEEYGEVIYPKSEKNIKKDK